MTAHDGTPTGDSRKTYTRGMGPLETVSGTGQAVVDTLSEGATAEVRWLGWQNPNRAVWALQRGGRWIVAGATEWDDVVPFRAHARGGVDSGRTRTPRARCP